MRPFLSRARNENEIVSRAYDREGSDVVREGHSNRLTAVEKHSVALDIIMQLPTDRRLRSGNDQKKSILNGVFSLRGWNAR